MLYWYANFQIPNSGSQSAEVFVIVDDEKSVNYYADNELTTHLFSKEYTFPEHIDEYDFLLSLDEFSQYVKI